MKIIFGVLGAVIFGFIGMFMGGLVEPYIVNQFTFTNPDDHGWATFLVNLGTALVIAAVGAVAGVLLARGLKHKVIRPEA